MEIPGIARALHVLAVVLWIGGVAMVTTVLLPALRRHANAAEQIELFQRLESRFAAQARWTTLLAGVTGFWLAWQFNLWARFAEARFWWMHAMVAVWLLFTLILFVLEPLYLHRRLLERLHRDPSGTFALIQRFHWVLLLLSLITVFGAVAGSHGYL
ncbi:MAG TPA: hypothetical protein VIA19_07275 [Burkholderiales bacterium]|jgi:uncharacterized membrane protein